MATIKHRDWEKVKQTYTDRQKRNYAHELENADGRRVAGCLGHGDRSTQLVGAFAAGEQLADVAEGRVHDEPGTPDTCLECLDRSHPLIADWSLRIMLHTEQPDADLAA